MQKVLMNVFSKFSAISSIVFSKFCQLCKMSKIEKTIEKFPVHFLKFHVRGICFFYSVVDRTKFTVSVVSSESNCPSSLLGVPLPVLCANGCVVSFPAVVANRA